MNLLFYFFLILLAVQRISELVYAKKNETILRERGAVEYDRRGYNIIVVMHVLFFVSLVVENLLFDRGYNPLSLVFLTVFVFTQFLRYWSIKSLGVFWNTRIIVLPEAELITKGPYQYMKHPNYLAVAIEILVIPLIFSCYITAFVFSIINYLLISRRIRVEEKALKIS